MRALLAGPNSLYLKRVGRVLAESGWTVAPWPTPLAGCGTRVDLVILAGDAADADLKRSIDELRQNVDPLLLLLLGEWSTSGRLRALGLGADDLIQHDAPADLLGARVIALLRARGDRLRHSYRVGDLAIELGSRRVRRGGRAIVLTHREYQLLILLAQHAGLVLSRSTIIDRLWPGEFCVGDNAVDALASRLRRKIDPAAGPRLIQTVRGVGYCLADQDASPVEHAA